MVYYLQIDSYPILIPEKPIKAIASNPAAMSAIGVPCMALGIWDKLICSRIPAKITKANVNPIAVDMV